jgi:osmotically inducible protein OsmC
MAGVERRAEAVWHGNLKDGQGIITQVGSGAFGALPVTWAARTAESDGKTSPEELLAAAHAACFSMAFSNELAKAGHTADTMEVRAVCNFAPKPEGGWGVASMTLTARGKVPGIEESEFQRIGAQAKAGCPISGALKGNVEINLEATLEQ